MYTSFFLWIAQAQFPRNIRFSWNMLKTELTFIGMVSQEV